MKRLEEKNPKSCKACVLHGNYLMAVGNFKQAAGSVKKALKLAPDDRDALWLATRSELAAKHYKAARRSTPCRGVKLYKRRLGNALDAGPSRVALRQAGEGVGAFCGRE